MTHSPSLAAFTLAFFVLMKLTGHGWLRDVQSRCRPAHAAFLDSRDEMTFGLNFFLKFIPMPPGPPEGSPPAMLMAALYPSGYLAFAGLIHRGEAEGGKG